MKGVKLTPRAIVVRIIAIIVFAILAIRLGHIQLVDDRYAALSDKNYLREVVSYPPRGEIYDRNGELLAQNRLCYDVLVVRKDMPKEGFDLAFVDTWRDASDGAPMYRRMKALENLSPNTKFMYWIENFLISRVRAENFSDMMEKIESGDYISESFSEIIDKINRIY